MLTSHHLVIRFIDQLNVVAHDLQLGEPGVVFAFLSDALERVAHDRDEHVEERDLDEEGRQDE